jgi:AsmA protein
MAHLRRSLLWIVGIAAGLVVLAVAGAAVFVATFDVNRLVAPSQAWVKATTGRDLLISGGASLRFSLRPKLVANEVSLSNAAWAGDAPLASAKRIGVELNLVPMMSGRYEVVRLELVEPSLALTTDAQGRGNWQFGVDVASAAPAPTAKPAAAALQVSIERVDVAGGVVTYKDGTTGKLTEVAIDALSIAVPDAQGPVQAELRGKVDSTPFDLNGELGALEALAARRWPYPIDIVGKIAGRETALKTQVRVDDHTYAFEPLDLTLGSYIAKGRIAVTTGGARPRLVVDASLNALDAADLRASGGTAARPAAPAAKTSGFLFPQTELPLGALREVGADADIKLLIGHLTLAEGLVLQQVDTRFTLRDRRLEVPILRANLFGGGLNGRLVVDASHSGGPTIAVRADAHDLELAPLLALAGVKGEVRGSRATLAVDLKVQGNSPHAWASDAVGNVLLTVSRGTLDKVTLELGGPFERLFGAINPFQETDTSTELLCAVAYLPLARGVARIDRSLAIESTKAGASASGTLDFRHEMLDLSFKTGVRQGISLDMARVAQLVRLAGPFRDPSVRVDAVASAAAAARIGAAVGTGGLSTVGSALLQQGAQGGSGPCEVAMGKAAPQARDEAKSVPASDKAASGGTPLPHPFPR